MEKALKTKFYTDQKFGGKRAYIGARAVVWPEKYTEPLVGICSYLSSKYDDPIWVAIFGCCEGFDLDFQPIPEELKPGEWCWPISGPVEDGYE